MWLRIQYSFIFIILSFEFRFATPRANLVLIIPYWIDLIILLLLYWETEPSPCLSSEWNLVCPSLERLNLLPRHLPYHAIHIKIHVTGYILSNVNSSSIVPPTASVCFSKNQTTNSGCSSLLPSTWASYLPLYQYCFCRKRAVSLSPVRRIVPPSCVLVSENPHPVRHHTSYHNQKFEALSIRYRMGGSL